MEPQNLLFRKSLSMTDATTHTLTCTNEFVDSLIAVLGRPAINLNCRPGHNTTFEVYDVDDGLTWTFKCNTRQKGTYPKPYIRGNWGAFAHAKGLQAGYILEFYHSPHIPAHIIVVIIRAP